MRVAYVLEQCWNRVPGGTAAAAIAVAAELARRDDTEMVGVSAWHRRPAPAPFAPPIPVRRLPMHRLALFEAWHLRRRPSVARATGAVDVIHATGLAIPPRTAPLVVTLHDLAFVHDPSQFTAKGRRFFQQALALIISDADVVLVSSEATHRDAVANGLDPARLRVVPLGVESRVVTDADIVQVRRRLGLERPFVLWVGTVEPRKNLPRLLDAFASLTDLDVDLVLVGPDGWHESLDRQLAHLGGRVHRLGFVDGATRDALYAAAHVFTLPSIREGFGLPVLEAMAQGTAVVTSRGTSTEEIVGRAGLTVDPLDTAALAKMLRSVLQNDRRRQELGEAGADRARDFSWKMTAEATRAAYGEVQ